MIELFNIDCMEYMRTCKDNEFDLVLGNSVMLFLNHDIASEEVSRVLREGGRFLLSNESLSKSPLVRLSRKLNLGYKSKDLEKHVNVRLIPAKS